MSLPKKLTLHIENDTPKIQSVDVRKLKPVRINHYTTIYLPKNYTREQVMEYVERWKTQLKVNNSLIAE